MGNILVIHVRGDVPGMDVRTVHVQNGGTRVNACQSDTLSALHRKRSPHRSVTTGCSMRGSAGRYHVVTVLELVRLAIDCVRLSHARAHSDVLAQEQ